MKFLVKKLSIFFVLSLLFITNIIAQNNLVKKLYFTQQDKQIPYNQSITLQNVPFEIHFKNISKDAYISIFVTTDFDYEYETPTANKSIDVNETIMFNPGTYLIKGKFNEKKGHDLTVVDSYGFNGFQYSERINRNSEAIIPVTSISDKSGLFNGTADFYFFVDYNNNNVIEENEFTKIKINISGDGNLFSNQKAYISTVGYKVENMRSLPKDNDYHVYVIESFLGALKFIAEVTSDASNLAYFMENSGSQLKDARFYIVHSPVTNTILLQQPYVISGSKNLIFEVRETDTPDESENSYYISARNYWVYKNKDRFTIYIKTDAGLIKPTVHYFN